MPKEPHSKFIVSADPYPAVDTSKQEMIYQAPDEDTKNGRSTAQGDQDWETFLDSIIKTEEPDLTLPILGLPVVHGQIEFDYPSFFEYQGSCTGEIQFEQGMSPDVEPLQISMDKLFETDDSDKEDQDSTEEPPYSELLEDDWDVGILRKEHSAEFQADAGLDFGDEKLGEADDDEGDIWNKEE
jgi:hypothetical protein